MIFSREESPEAVFLELFMVFYCLKQSSTFVVWSVLGSFSSVSGICEYQDLLLPSGDSTSPCKPAKGPGFKGQSVNDVKRGGGRRVPSPPHRGKSLGKPPLITPRKVSLTIIDHRPIACWRQGQVSSPSVLTLALGGACSSASCGPSLTDGRGPPPRGLCSVRPRLRSTVWRKEGHSLELLCLGRARPSTQDSYSLCLQSSEDDLILVSQSAMDSPLWIDYPFVPGSQAWNSLATYPGGVSFLISCPVLFIKVSQPLLSCLSLPPILVVSCLAYNLPDFSAHCLVQSHLVSCCRI